MKLLAFVALFTKQSCHVASSFKLNNALLPRRNLCLRAITSTTGISWEGNEVRLRDAYSDASSYLEKNGVPESEISARMMVCDITKIGYRMSDFNNNQDIILSDIQLNQLSEYCRLRRIRTPLQYVIGNWDFYGFTILCKPPVLIPRPETEELVENILSSGILQNLGRGSRILDVGSGTGVIGIALLSQLPTATCDAIDINNVAVELSNENAGIVLKQPKSKKSKETELTQRYKCQLKSFLDFSNSDEGKGCYDIIVSNPPYIPTGDLADLEPEIVKFEDKGALDGGEDGLDMVRDLIFHSKHLFNPKGPKELWIEVSNTHPAIIERWFSTPGPHRDEFDFIEGITDFAGNPRFVRLKARIS